MDTKGIKMKTINRLLVFLFLNLLIVFKSTAGHEKGSTRLNLNNYSSTNNMLFLQDNKIAKVQQLISSNVSPGFFDHTYKNKLVLAVDKNVLSIGNASTSLSGNKDFSAEVVVTLISNKVMSLNNPPFNMTSTSVVCTLKVTSKGLSTSVSNILSGATEIDLDSYGFDFSYQTLAIINSITIRDLSNNQVVNPSVLPANVYLELQCDAERYYDLDVVNIPFSSAPNQFFVRYYSGNTTGNQIEVNWPMIPGADEYDLEWSWLDEFNFPYSISSGNFANPSWAASPELSFRNNSTRIRTGQNSYRISNTFESGYLFFRIRGVGKAKTPASLTQLGNDPISEVFTPWTWQEFTSSFPLPAGFAPISSINSIGQTVISNIQVGGGIQGFASVPLFINLIGINFEQNKNWTYLSNFAEDGKKKEGATFLDGTLRSRQELTSNNTTNKVTVSETYYDFLGRPAVKTVPAPINDGTFKLYQASGSGLVGFNYEDVSTLARPFGKGVFATGGGACGFLNGITGIKPSVGTSTYYSPNNAFLNLNNKLETSYTPDGESFPFIQTEYVPDFTGKVARMSGVGPTFKIHNQTAPGTKHDTRFMYSVPFQEELDRLFGSEVGYANRYSKEVSIDPNGQASLKYLNEQGKVVATALTGVNPASTNALKNSAGIILNGTGNPISVDLLNKSAASNVDTEKDNNILIGDALVFNQDVIVTSPQNYEFDYILSAPSGFGLCSLPGLCLDCVYDLTFDITDQCGNRPSGFTAPIVINLGKVVASVNTPATPDNTCNDDQVYFRFSQLYNTSVPVTQPLVVYLDQGVYTVTKKLTVNNSTLEKYLEMYLASCALSLTQFEQAESANVNTSGCNNTCEQCVQALGTLQNYITTNQSVPTPPQSEVDRLTAEFNQLIASCTEPCRYVSYCDAAKEAMLIDMSPNGQYADYEGPNNTFSPGSFPLSIYNLNNQLSKKTALGNPPSWKEPSHYWLTGNQLHYYEDDNVTISYVDVVQVSPGVFQPPVQNTSFLTPAYATNQNLTNYQVEPQYLLSGSDFVTAWKPSWANSLIKYHPEYCYLEWCLQNRKVTGPTVGPIFNYNIDPVTGDPTTLNNTPFTVNTSDAYDSLLVAVDDLDYIGSGTNGTSYVLDPFQYDPYWTTNAYYLVAPANPAFPSTNPAQALPQPAGNLATNGINSSPNVKQLQPNPYPADFSGTGLHFPDKFIKTANERFWNFKGTGLNLYQYAAIITSPLAAQQGINVATLISNLNASPMYVVGAPNPSSPITYITNLANSTSNPAQKDQKRKTWEFFKTMYLNLKQELQQEAAESYVMNSGCRGCNDCIGEASFDSKSVPFTTYSNYQLLAMIPITTPQQWATVLLSFFQDWYFPYMQNNKAQQCGVTTSSLYKNKAKRFPQNKDANALTGDGSNSNAEANIYASTGLCPTAFYFKNVLNDMVDPTTSNNLKSATSVSLWQVAPSFNHVLYEVITGGAASANTPMYSNVSAIGSILVGKIAVTGFSDLRFSLTFVSAVAGAPTSPSMTDWANYPNTYQITSFDNFQTTGTHMFSATARVKAIGSNPVQIYDVMVSGNTSITGYTALNLSKCGSVAPCKLNGNGKAIRDLMNSLIQTNQFATSTAVDLGGGTAPANVTNGSPHNAIFNNYIKPILSTGSPNNSVWKWTQTSTSLPFNFWIDDGSTGPNPNKKLLIEILNSQPALTQSDLQCINSIENFRIDPTTPWKFLATLSTKVVPGLSAACTPKTFDIEGEITIGPYFNWTSRIAYNYGTCDFDILTCQGAEYDLPKDIDEFGLWGSLGTMVNSNSLDLTSNPYFSLLMREYLGNTNGVNVTGTNPPLINSSINYFYWLKDQTNSNANSVTGWIFKSASATIPLTPPADACKFTLGFEDPSATHLAANIYSGLNSTQVFPIQPVGIINNGAFYKGRIKNVVGDNLILETSCFPMRACESCEGTTPGTNGTQITNWTSIQDFSCSNLTPFTLDYFDAQAPVVNVLPYTVLPCTTAVFGPSLKGFQAQVVAGSSACFFDWFTQYAVLFPCYPPSQFGYATAATVPFGTGAPPYVNSLRAMAQENVTPYFSTTWPFYITQTYCIGSYESTYEQNFTMPIAGVAEFTTNIQFFYGLTNQLFIPMYEIEIDGQIRHLDGAAFYSNSGTLFANWTSGLPLTQGNHVLKIRVKDQMAGTFPLLGFAIEPIGLRVVNTTNTKIPCANNPFPTDTLPTVEYEEPCAPYLHDNADNAAAVKYEQYIEDLKSNFVRDYKSHCLGQVVENMTMKYTDNDYHFTLYYYDQAGNLIRTIPPEGVRLLNPTTTGNSAIFQNLKTQRANYPTNQTIFTNHELKTTYTYNSLNQLVKQETPDAGISEFYYDNLGRLVLSRNAVQQAKSGSTHYYSYTKYDELNRISEVGEIGLPVTATSYGATLPTILGAANFPANMNPTGRYEVTKTYYQPEIYFGYLGTINFSMDYARQRVATVVTEEVYDGNDWTFDNAVHYSYDVHGNVKEIMNENRAFSSTPFASHRFKRCHYKYDLLSSKVKEMVYQNQEPDMFTHKYEYDAENRLTNVYTSRNGWNWDQDAKYYYYMHGPLARVELGEHKVQGVDYAYTLQGWIKGVNSDLLLPVNDMGKDGFNNLKTNSTTNYVHNFFGRDAFGYSLNYFGTNAVDDYKPVNSSIYSSTSTYFLGKLPPLAGSYPALFNGNISSMSSAVLNVDPLLVTLPNTGGQAIARYGTYSQWKLFKYDQLNRITEVSALSNFINSSNVRQLTSGYTSQYAETFTYDQNGNIITALRNSATTAIDNLQYYYYTKTGSTYLPGSGTTSGLTNRLARVTDALGAPVGSDIGNQTLSTNYTYDANGNLIGDASEQIASIEWTVYGKIKRIIRATGSSKKNLEFKYDAQGNRISKRVYTGTTVQTDYETTYYQRDASGNVIATYVKDHVSQSPQIVFRLQELTVYGSQRLGVVNPNTELMKSQNGSIVYANASICKDRNLGTKSYELSNHLGNVLTVVSDRKIGLDATSDGTCDYYLADILSTNDYYAFGSPMPGRQFNNGSYRYGFNGKENDPETAGTGQGTQDYGLRIYNPALGRFLSIDPLTHAYPWYTPYQFAGNKPINSIDLDGAEECSVIERGERTDETAVKDYGLKGAAAEAYMRVRKIARAAGGVAGGLTVLSVYTAGRTVAIIPRVLMWASANPEVAMQGTALLGGLFYDGPEDLAPNTNADEIGKAFRGAGRKTLDFFGGQYSKYNGSFNIDKEAKEGFKGTVAQFYEFMKKQNLLGTVDDIIADNPYDYAGYLNDAAGLLKSGGTITIRGTWGNQFFNKVVKGKIEGYENFKVKSLPTKVSKEGMKTSNGKDIVGDVYEIILERK